MARTHVIPCSVFGGKSPKTGKPVASRHRWSGRAWGHGRCIYCHRMLHEVLEPATYSLSGHDQVIGLGIDHE